MNLATEVMWVWVGKAKGYCIEDRSFSVPELKILIDAVQAASFITGKKTAELIDKIAELGGSHKAEILKSNMVCFNTRKHMAMNRYTIVALHCPDIIIFILEFWNGIIRS